MATTRINFSIFCFLLYTLVFAQDWQQTQGPYGGVFNNIKRYKDGSLFLSVDGGFYKSTDNALNWQRLNIGNYDQISSGEIFFHPTGCIFISYSGNLYRSDTTGLNWEFINSIIGGVIGIDNKGNIYATKEKGLIVSRDLGNSFQDFKFTDNWVFDFIEIEDSHLIFPSGQSVFITNDRGITWNEIKLPTQAKWILKLQSDSKKNLYAITESELFCSKDFGKTWTNILFPEKSLATLFINSKDEIFISGKFLYSSKDEGKTWNQTTLNDYLLFINEDINGDLYAGSYTTLYRKKESNIWSPFEVKINNRRISYLLSNKNDLYILSLDEFYRSTDLGNSWSQPYKPNWGFIYLFQVDSKGRIFGAVDENLSYSTNKGDDWIKIPFIYNEIPFILVSPDDIIYASSYKGEILYTKDFGKTWVSVWKDVSDNPYMGKMALTRNNELLFSSGKNLYKFSIASNSTEFLGTLDKRIGSIAVSPLGTIYATSNGIYMLHGKQNWLKIAGDKINFAGRLSITENNEMIFFNYNEMYISKDLGKSFIRVPKPKYAAATISFFHDNEGNYFLGTQENGLFKYTISTSKPELPASVNVSQNFPNPFNGQTAIQFTIPNEQAVSLKVFDILGREIETIINSTLPIGYYKFYWRPLELSSGIYIYQLRTDSFVETKKMIFMK